MPTTLPPDYYQRFDASKNYDEHLFIAGKSLQSAELNEIQKSSANRLKNVADILFKNGAVIRDCIINVNETTGVTSCGAGAVYANGAVRTIGESTLTIPVVGYVAVGFRLIETVISELNDPALRDPATAVQNYDSPGALRLKIEAHWAHHLDGQNGDFFAVYDVRDGMVAPKESPPAIDALSSAIQKYDQDSTGGTYAISGLEVTSTSQASSIKHLYRVGRGSARINGRSIDLVADRTFAFDAVPDLQMISSEPFLSTTAGTQRITTDFAPIATISLVSVTALKTVNLVHGVVTGAQDLLPDTSVIEIVSASQGGTTFAKGPDYQLTGGKVDWSPVGAEPAPGSTYSVSYKYVSQVTPTGIDDTGFTVTGAVAGTLVMVTYHYKIPRVDRLCVGVDGEAVLIRGTPSVDLPTPPSVPRNLLLLSTIRHSWFGALSLTQDGIRMVPMESLNGVNGRIDRLVMLMAQSRLESNAAGRDAALKKSMFADPFLDDSMRDAGVGQTAAVIDGALTLPVALHARYFSADVAAPVTLPHVTAYDVVQESKTGTMKVNPYSAFSPMQATVTLSPSVDQMTYTTEAYTSSTTSRIVTKVSNLSSAGSTFVESIDTLGAVAKADLLIRPQYVEFQIDGFGPGEHVSRMSFDVVDIPILSTQTKLPAPAIADSNGRVTGTFAIPSGIKSGVVRVQFVGSGGSFGSTIFTAASWAMDKILRRHTTEYVNEYVPVVPPSGPVEPPLVVDPGSIVNDDPGGDVDPVTAMYQNWLGRSPEPAGLAYWQGQLSAHGGNISAIAESFVYASVIHHETLSTEATSIYIANQADADHCIIDPLAQTFMLTKDAQIATFAIWFSAVGASDIIVQLRTTSNGFPTQKILAECRKKPSTILVNGSPTVFEFSSPVYASAGEELVIVVLCNDAVTQVDVAEIGQWDGAMWVTEQPYVVGVLLSSSNALTWTAHQDRDLRFRIGTSVYTSNSLLVDLGVVPVIGVTDLMVMGLASKPAAAAGVNYIVTLPDGEVRTVSANVPLNLSSSVTGDVHVKAVLSGSSSMSPILYPDGQLACGWLKATGDYVSRAMAAGPSSRIRVIVDALIPTGAAVEFRWKGSDVGDTWSAPIPFLSSLASDSGFTELTHQVTGVNENFVQIKVVLSGTPAARPFLRNLRVMVM